MRTLRWILLILYLVLIGILIAVAAVHGASAKEYWPAILIAFGLFTQVFFLSVRGNPKRLRPTRPRQILVPAIIGGLMMALLIACMVMALLELCRFHFKDDTQSLFMDCAILNWIVWGFLFYAACCRLDCLAAMRRIVLTLIFGSLLQLLATVPSHLIVVRRPGCMVGHMTALGIFGGLCVMTWAFGPGIVFLFLYETRKRTAGHCPECGYYLRGLTRQRCPECGTPFTFEEIRATPEDLHFAGPLDEQPGTAEKSLDGLV